jgi:hypothetical protein
MSKIFVDQVDPKTATTLTLGTTGDTVSIPTGVGLTVTDEVKTNKISPATGTAFALGDSGDTFTVPSGATIVNSGTATGFGGGKVLQVINATTTTETAMTSTTFADTTLTADITPAATANKILVIVNQWFANYRTSASTIGAGLQLLRGGSVIYNPKASGAGGRNFWLNATGTSYLDLQMIYSFSYLDSPSTTSSTTYKTQQAIAEDDNQTAVSQLDSGVSTIILMEIEG